MRQQNNALLLFVLDSLKKTGDCFYSSQMTIDACGRVIDLYRRVSPGWKIASANEQYCEGKGFHTFSFMGKEIVIGLCGDFWFDENIDEVKQLQPDVVFWPVYTDYPMNEWNTAAKYEYAEQAKKLSETVLYVNSVCQDRPDDRFAKGGAALFQNGRISCEVPSGEEAILFVEI